MRRTILVSASMVKNLMSITLVILICSCDINVNTKDGGSTDSLKSGISVKIIDKLDSVVEEGNTAILKKADTAVQRINRDADSVRSVLKRKKKELQEQIGE